MLSSQTIKMLPQESDRLNVEVALMTLAASGVLMLEVEQRQKGIMARFDQDDVETVAKEILELRAITKTLTGIHNIGKQLLKEKGNSK